MNIRSQIENYVPFNKQEIKDKEMILKYIDSFDDILTRENEIAHFTSSGFVLNETRDKVLLIYHNIYNSWGWTGGHVDGESNFLEVAKREVQEETGVKNVKAIDENIFTIDVLPVISHIKKEKYVSAHVHISMTYLIEVSDTELLSIKEDENSNVAWFSLDSFLDFVKEEHMKPVYNKIIEKAKYLNLINIEFKNMKNKT